MSNPIAHWKKKSVSLVGMDGSGKSTQVRYLTETLQKQHVQVMVIHPFGWKILSFLSPRFIDRPVGGTGAKPEHQASASSGRLKQLVAWIEICDIALYIWISFLRYFVYAFLMKKRVWLVCDRSFDDILVKHISRKTLSPLAVRTVRRLIPQTENTIWLRTDPTVAMQRDQEFPESYYRELADCYFAAAEQFGWQIVQTTRRSPETVWANVKDILDLEGTDNGLEQPLQLGSR